MEKRIGKLENGCTILRNLAHCKSRAMYKKKEKRKLFIFQQVNQEIEFV